MEALQKYIVDVKEELVTGHNCLLACLRYITEHYGCSYSEAQLFLLINNFKIRYGNNLNEFGRHPLEGLKEFERRTLISLKIRRRYRDEIFPEQMLQELKSSMLMLAVDTKLLGYNKLYSANENRKHFIIMYVIDIGRKTASIIDLYMLDYKGDVSSYRGEISFDEIFAAMDRYFCFCFDSKRDLSEREILKYACSDIQNFISGSRDNQGAIGSTALRSFLEDLIRLETLDKQQLVSTCSSINYNIKIRSFNLINRYMTNILDENEAIRRIDSKDLLSSIRWHMAEWDRIGLSIIKYGISKGKSNLACIIDRSMKLLDSQMEVYEKFSCLLNDAISKVATDL